MMKYITILCAFAFIGLSTESTAQTTYKTVDGYPACVSKKYIDDFVTYSTDKDLKAMQSLLDAGVCIAMKSGLTVYLVDTSWGLVSFRMKGDTNVFWTVREGIK